jgi:hypothetical protein
MTTNWKKAFLSSLLFVSACALVVSTMVSPTLARPDFGVRAGAYSDDNDDEDAFLGAEALFSMGTGQRWFGNPNLEHTFVEDGDMNTASFDFHYDFTKDRPYTWWAGAGPTLIFREDDPSGNDDTDAGVNLLIGLGDKKGEVRPYGQMKVIVSDDTQAVLAAGVRF